MKAKNIIIYIIICIIAIAGVVVWKTNGFNKELQYSSRYEMNLYKNTEFDISEVKKIADEVLGNTRHFVQRNESFNNIYTVVSEEITDEQKKQMVEKFNEKFQDSKMKVENVTVRFIPFTRVKDVIKHFIIPGIIAEVLLLVYFLTRYRNLGKLGIILKTIIIPIAAELVLFGIVSVARLPFGRIAIALGIGLYLLAVLYLTFNFENKKNSIIENENDGKEE